jgi:hypothetical protein
VESALKALHAEFNREIVKEITSDKICMCSFAVVGAGMAGTPGVAKKVFGALGNAMINIIMISQGSSSTISLSLSGKMTHLPQSRPCMTNSNFITEMELKNSCQPAARGSRMSEKHTSTYADSVRGY